MIAPRAVAGHELREAATAGLGDLSDRSIGTLIIGVGDTVAVGIEGDFQRRENIGSARIAAGIVTLVAVHSRGGTGFIPRSDYHRVAPYRNGAAEVVTVKLAWRRPVSVGGFEISDLA